MKLKKVILIILLTFFYLESYSQDEKYVIAESGLIFRNKPKGKILGKFDFGEKLEIIERTGISQKIIDNGLSLNGEWVGIKYKNKKVFAFSGYIVDKKEFELINERYYETYFKRVNKKYDENIRKHLKISPISKKEYKKTISKKRKNIKKIEFKYVIDDDNENPYRVYSSNNYKDGFENKPSLSPNEDYLVVAGVGWDSYGYVTIISVNSNREFENIIDVGFTNWTKSEEDNCEIKWSDNKTFIFPINEKIVIDENHHEIKKEIKYLKIELIE